LLSKVDIFDIRNNQTLSQNISIPQPFHVDACCELLSKVDIFDIRNNLNCNEQLLATLSYGSSCELLSKVDIFDIRNKKDVHVVVNCSQKLISLIFGTTRNDW
jgi:hypothetical protein